jgi:MYXO-CTERM domain-containing protein
MRHGGGAFPVAILVAVAACGPEGGPEPLARESSAIIGGTRDGGHPAVGAVLASQQGGLCTGTLISPHVVVTAAHCNEGGTPDEFILADSIYSGNAISISKFIRDPGYSANAYGQGVAAHDVALCILASAASPTPIPYRRETLDGNAGQAITFVGYGLTNSSDQQSAGTKYEVTTTIGNLPNPDGFWNYGGSPVKNTCNGDSGGPALMTVNGADQVVGLVSSGDQACAEEGWNTRVDANVAFLDQYVKQYDPGFVTNPVCGNGTCDTGETNATCPGDCPAVCGNGVCETGETKAGCAVDCDADGTLGLACSASGACPRGQSCYGSDQTVFTNDFCSTACATAADCPSGFSCGSIGGDTSICQAVVAACGNGTCDAGETNASCPADCPAACGNGVCETGETEANCAVDCDTDGTLGLPCSKAGSCPAGQGCYGSDHADFTNDFCSRTCTAAGDCPTAFSCQAIGGGTSICETTATGTACGDGGCPADGTADVAAADAVGGDAGDAPVGTSPGGAGGGCAVAPGPAGGGVAGLVALLLLGAGAVLRGRRERA